MPIKPAGLADARGREGGLSPAPLRREGKRLPWWKIGRIPPSAVRRVAGCRPERPGSTDPQLASDPRTRRAPPGTHQVRIRQARAG
jgi:hypothetical protein